MDELHAAIAVYLRHQRAGPPQPDGDAPERSVPAHPPWIEPPSGDERETAIYARVDMVNQGVSADLEAQVAACGAFAWSCGKTSIISFREVADDDMSERPRLTELRTAIAQGWVAAVLVTTYDRLTHDAGFLAQLREEWSGLGVKVIAVMDEDAQQHRRARLDPLP